MKSSIQITLANAPGFVNPCHTPRVANCAARFIETFRHKNTFIKMKHVGKSEPVDLSIKVVTKTLHFARRDSRPSLLWNCPLIIPFALSG